MQLTYHMYAAKAPKAYSLCHRSLIQERRTSFIIFYGSLRTNNMIKLRLILFWYLHKEIESTLRVTYIKTNKNSYNRAQFQQQS